MGELENLPEMRYNVENFERFAHLVRVIVVKLKAENRQQSSVKARCTEQEIASTKLGVLQSLVKRE